MHKLIPLFLVLLILLGCSAQSPQKPMVTFKTDHGEVAFDVEVASTPQEWDKGLMFRESLGKSEGMLFIFEIPGVYSFWMENTPIPLDMVYIGQDLRVIDVLAADPCEKDPCAIYTSRGDALYVLEINQNSSVEHSIGIGDEVNFNQEVWEQSSLPKKL